MNKAFKIYFCRNATIEPLWPTLRKRAEAAGWSVLGEMSGYSDFETQPLDPDSSLHRFEPDLVWVWLELAQLHEPFWYRFASLTPRQVAHAEEEIYGRLDSFLSLLLDRVSAPVVAQNFPRPAWPALGLAENHAERGQWAAVERINRRLADRCAQDPRLYLFDYDRLASRLGLAARVDPKHWYLSNLALAASWFQPYADEWLRTLNAIHGKRKKCIVLDLDNTLWGGVVGEDGLQGIRLGGGYPGNAFQDFQKALLNLHRQGILLAVCSKNNEADAWEVFDRHPEMVLKRGHIAAHRINWIDKAANLRDLAAELNLGLDSFVFLDDRPEEREWIRTQLPDVVVPDFPAEPFRLPRFLQSLDGFDTFRLSEEDRKRTDLYRTQALRTETRRQSGTMEDYLRSLKLRMEILPLNDLNLGRIAQLTQKTNQFNVLTRRFSEAEMKAYRDRGGLVFCGRVADRFGDSGIVILAMATREGSEARIDNFLMSCRVIGLTVEQAFFGWLARSLAAAGVARIQSGFAPTEKNALAADFHARMGFAKSGEEPDGATRWTLNLPGGSPVPPWFELNAPHTPF